ncbi:MAG: apolipoprotein N-acyltransferase [Proteobacteria bacterium]|nr:apolipoprotein N-acyltransferase [Pseudomonadota bacterium]
MANKANNLSVALLQNWLTLPWVRRLVAVLLGSLAVVGFAPYDFPLATLLALVGVWGLWATASSWQRAAQEGLAFGVGFFGFGVSWLGISLWLYGGVPFGVTWLVVLLFVVVLALFIALVGGFANWAKGLMPLFVWSVLLLPSFWVFSEWLRVIVWDGFPWLLVGYSHADTWLAGWAPITGTLGVSFAVAMSAGLLWWAAQMGQWIPGVLLYGVLWGLSGQLGAIQWVVPKGHVQAIGFVHGQFSELTKWDSKALPNMLRAYQQASNQLLDKTKVIVWPETAIPTFLDNVMPFLDELKQQANAQGVTVLTGSALREDTLQGRQYFNSLVSLNGETRYDKRHLVPFSEYYPGFALLSALAKLINLPMAQFSHGSSAKVQPIAGQSVALGVCYEADFGYEMARVSAPADWWLIVSDDGWFHPSAMAGQHWQMTRLRARELGREILRVTNQGYSGVAHVDGNGSVAASPNDPLAAHLARVQAYEGITPYVRYQDMPLLGWLSFVFALLAMRWRQHQRMLAAQ